MAMVKPIADSLVAFDATKGVKVSFTSNGGDQVVKNKIVVRNNTTNAIVYQNTIESYKLENIIQPNVLTNGVNYNYSIYTYNVNGVSSEESNRVSFWCYTTPSLSFANITDNQKVSNSYYRFEIKYEQLEGENIKEAIFILSNHFGEEISRSNSIYFVGQNVVGYTIYGFSDETEYYIQAVAQTVHGTLIYTDNVPFIVSYKTCGTFNLIDIENDCENGVMKIKNNLIRIKGTSNISNLTYIEDERLRLKSINETVTWNEGFKLKNDSTFNFGIWFKPQSYGEFCFLTNDSRTINYSFQLCRGTFDNTTYVYIALVGKYNDGTTFLTMVSNKITDVEFNNLVYCTVILGYDGLTKNPTLNFKAIKVASNILYWSEKSNADFDKISDFECGNSVYTEPTIYYGDATPTLLFPITSITIKNGEFDHINLENAIRYNVNSQLPTWNSSTILDCNFRNNIEAGNVKTATDNIDALTLKRRKKDTFNWIELYQKTITNADDFNFIYYDCLCPSNETFEWAIVPSLNGVEGEYTIFQRTSKFNYCFLYDITSMFKFYGNVSYGSTQDNINIGRYETLSNKYPIIVNNGEVNYKSGSVSFTLMSGNTATNSGILNRKNEVELGNRLLSFLTNGLSKVMKDWNGNIYIIQIVDKPTLSYGNNGMGKISVSFNWVEQGQYDNQTDLHNNSLLM